MTRQTVFTLCPLNEVIPLRNQPISQFMNLTQQYADNYLSNTEKIWSIVGDISWQVALLEIIYILFNVLFLIKDLNEHMRPVIV